MKISKRLIAELKNKEYRDAFVSEHIDTGIPFQVRALREYRGLTQKELAERAGMKQERISAIENPNYKNAFTLSTLKRLASAFDIALIVRFAPISQLVDWELKLSPESLQAVSFDQDLYFNETPQELGGTASSLSFPQISGQGFAYGGQIFAQAFANTSSQPEKTNLHILDDSRQRPSKEREEAQKEMQRPLLKMLAGGRQ